MEYAAYVRREGRHWLAELPDCPGCQTFASSERKLARAAKEALEGWLESHLVDGEAPPRPRVGRKRAPRGSRLAWIEVEPTLAVALRLRWARSDAGLTQAELARRVGVSQQQIGKLERPGENPSIATLAKIARALDVPLDIRFGSRRVA